MLDKCFKAYDVRAVYPDPLNEELASTEEELRSRLDELARKEGELRESDQRFRTITEISPVQFFQNLFSCPTDTFLADLCNSFVSCLECWCLFVARLRYLDHYEFSVAPIESIYFHYCVSS